MQNRANGQTAATLQTREFQTLYGGHPQSESSRRAKTTWRMPIVDNCSSGLYAEAQLSAYRPLSISTSFRRIVMTTLIELETLRRVLQEELRPMKESIQRLEDDSKDTRKKVNQIYDAIEQQGYRFSQAS